MEEKQMSIKDLLNTMVTLNKPREKGDSVVLENSRETWRRIRQKDSFDELGFSRPELYSFLQTWVSDNPYSNI